MGKPIVSKYQSDWDQQGQDMGYEVWLPCKNYNILVTLMVKNDQTKVHIVPMTKKHTRESKSTKHIKISRIEDKRQMKLIVSSFANGFLCPLQNVFTSTTHRSLPLNNWRKTNYINNLWDLTFNENGWLNLETTKWFVHKICYRTFDSQLKNWVCRNTIKWFNY